MTRADFNNQDFVPRAATKILAELDNSRKPVLSLFKRDAQECPAALVSANDTPAPHAKVPQQPLPKSVKGEALVRDVKSRGHTPPSLRALRLRAVGGPHEAKSDDDLRAAAIACDNWFLRIMGMFCKLHGKKKTEETAAAAAFVWSQRFKIKESFWKGETKDVVVCRLIDGFAGLHLI